MKWYVLAVPTGKELLLRDKIGALGILAMVPQAMRKIRRGGQWHDETETLLPGYILICCDYSADIYYKVRGLSGSIRPLNNALRPAPLPEDEAIFWTSLNPDGHPAGISFIDGGGVRILSGPLAGMTGSVISLNLRQKRATVSATIFGREHRITLGAETLTKLDGGFEVDSLPQSQGKGHSSI